MTPNGQFFKRDIHGFLPKMMQNMYDDRVQYKEQMIEAQKQYELNKTKTISNRIPPFLSQMGPEEINFVGWECVAYQHCHNQRHGGAKRRNK